MGDDAEVVWSMVDFYRVVLLTKCGGLEDEQLKRRSVRSTNLTLLGILRHMTDIEHYWFGECCLGNETDRGDSGDGR